MEDRTKAVALELAKAHLEMKGYKYRPEDIGKTAAVIINAMNTSILEK